MLDPALESMSLLTTVLRCCPETLRQWSLSPTVVGWDNRTCSTVHILSLTAQYGLNYIHHLLVHRSRVYSGPICTSRGRPRMPPSSSCQISCLVLEKLTWADQLAMPFFTFRISDGDGDEELCGLVDRKGKLLLTKKNFNELVCRHGVGFLLWVEENAKLTLIQTWLWLWQTLK